MNSEQIKLRSMIVTALFAAVIGVMAQMVIPIPPVPITGQTLAIGLAATILGAKYGTFSVLLYLMIGAAGVPVFAEFSGGLSTIVGPTGGYLIGFIPAVFIMGFYMEKTAFTFLHAMIANTIGMLIALIFGTVWLKIAADMSWLAAIAGGITPFIIVGLIKAALAAWIGVLVRKRLQSAKLLLPTEYTAKKTA
ncbi:biotin transporter BioY [Bacillus mesophilum]|uniref:Biotin transporter n=1 Tax=Bacillus mesophilum TaxID=1071718 RepID=A0A7V7RIA0_9BACI|nr:biotin transporter BioY [Bacillus mesophilum]KAB2329816.1 biotin transporter BioY [Bacillus mesophilum]